MNIKKYKYYVLTLFLFISNSQASNITVEVGYHFGGDELAVTGSSNSNTYKINAGELMSLAVGSHIYLDHEFYLRTLVGIKSTFGIGDSGDVVWSRFLVEFMPFIRVDKWAFGAGLSYQLNPRLSGGYVQQNNITNTEYKNTLGFVFEVDYQQGESSYVGIKYTVIAYEPVNSVSNAINGNSVGFVMGTVF
ncbi:hypothetical protein MNBD_GAMMA22-1667 [hydrothermal vent metagenome]|uniref:Outer membrane protein beta-barrel domain-containing protein n=1 Tax=hydrothermal vent metagenome TaxID=652676 RepID=A0A3B1A433_9ZZZZ